MISAVVENQPEEISAVLEDLVLQAYRHGLAGLFGLKDENHPVHVAGQGDPVGRCGGRGGIDQDEVEFIVQRLKEATINSGAGAAIY